MITEKTIASAGPVRLVPLYMDRVWGGRTLETKYGRRLPSGDVPYGESWEVVDREHEQSVVLGGPLDGMTLNELWRKHREAVFGKHAPGGDRFPLLVKILDARDTLSLQVHPPASLAPALGGEPKTEMWYIAEAAPDACLYAGVKDGVTRESFEKALKDGTAAELVPKIPVKAGDFIFIPSGRLHAIGAGLLIFEIQQNSDTTYRVFDWNRVGLDGKPRALHIQESLQCIDFNDRDPKPGVERDGTLVECEHFRVFRRVLAAGEAATLAEGEFRIMGVVEGELLVSNGMVFRPGDWALLPACLNAGARTLTAKNGDATLLEVAF